MIRERFLALGDYDYCCAYEILESPMGVENYVATEFDCDEGRERELTDRIGNGVFQGAQCAEAALCKAVWLQLRTAKNPPVRPAGGHFHLRAQMKVIKAKGLNTI